MDALMCLTTVAPPGWRPVRAGGVRPRGARRGARPRRSRASSAGWPRPCTTSNRSSPRATTAARSPGAGPLPAAVAHRAVHRPRRAGGRRVAAARPCRCSCATTSCSIAAVRDPDVVRLGPAAPADESTRPTAPPPAAAASPTRPRHRPPPRPRRHVVDAPRRPARARLADTYLELKARGGLYRRRGSGAWVPVMRALVPRPLRPPGPGRLHGDRSGSGSVASRGDRARRRRRCSRGSRHGARGRRRRSSATHTATPMATRIAVGRPLGVTKPSIGRRR